MAQVSMFGDWAKVKAILANPGKKLQAAVRRATIRSALLLVREIKKGIRDQAPGGIAFPPLSEVTIDRKGSSKALIDTGFLINAITQRLMQDRAFVGLLRSSIGPDGQDRANIGAIMEHGATITMPNGNTVVIPPRPFIHPTLDKLKPQILGFYQQAIQSTFK